MKSILDKSFVYVDAASTDLKKTFARIRRQQKERAQREQDAKHEQILKVRPLNAR